MSGAYYNEHDEHAADWLDNAIAAGVLPPGIVDRRDIRDVRPEDLDGFTQVHLFAGIGGWALASSSVGWPADRPFWSASAPCQPFSRAGLKKGFDDPRHLWPEVERLVAARRPPVVLGEQSVDAAKWLASVRSRMDQMEYALGAVPFKAACAGAEHGRGRFYFVADADDVPRRLEQQQQQRTPQGPWDESRWRGEGVVVGDTASVDERRPRLVDGAGPLPPGGSGAGGLEWVVDRHGKARRAPSGVRRLVDGLSGRVTRLRADGEETVYSRVAALKGFGNALDQRAARAFIASCMRILIPMAGPSIVNAMMEAAAIMTGQQ